jgi:HEAT repeat protein
MAAIDILFQFIYVIVGIIAFSIGFSLVYKNLKKINTIEGEKFNIPDWTAMVGFGLLFGMAMLFIVNIVIDFIKPNLIPSIAGYILLGMLVVLVLYPLWEVIFLGKPTSDSVHDFHKFLESKILDRFKGKVAYLISFLIFIVLYILPILLIFGLTSFPIAQIGFMWFLIFPLFFLNYFAANGTVSGIISATYVKTIPSDILKHMGSTEATKTKIMNIIFIAIAWIPFLLNLYNFVNPILKAVSGNIDVESGGSDPLMGYISLFTTTVFGIKGFFSKFWNKKSKTKTIDFLFSGYLIIGIGVNMLLSFVQIQPDVVEGVFSSVGFLEPIGGIFSNYLILLPLIIVQSFITFTYGVLNLVQVNSDFHSDIRLQATLKAFGKIDLDQIVESRKKVLDLKESGEQEQDDEKLSKKKKKKKPKYNFPTLYKSLLIEPSYSKFGVDLNEQVRSKAAQYLFLICVDNKDLTQNVIDFVFNASIDITKDTAAEDQVFISKESIDLLGEIGEIYPNLLISRLIDALEYADIYTQRNILDALGDIGENKDNMIKILDKIAPFFKSNRSDVRQAALASLSEMVLEGNSEDKEFVNIALSQIYSILEEVDSPEVIDTCLDALVKMCARIADDIDFEKIVPFIRYNVGNDQDTIDYIVQNAIVVISYLVYYNLDKMEAILPELKEFLKNPKNFLRYVAVDALGNYILKCPEDKISLVLMEILILSTNDLDNDVAQMATESIAEFLVMHKGYQVEINNQKISILDYYLNALTSDDKSVSENASEALKQISPLYDEDIYPILEKYLKEASNLELVRDCLHVIALSGEEEHLSTDLELVYQLTKHEEPSVRSEAIHALGYLIKHRKEVDPKYVITCLDDLDPQVRREAIFSLGKIGQEKPQEIVPVIIQKFFELDRESDATVSEVELYSETLGQIGKYFPSNEIIMTLQNVLMGDTNPFSKDVIARALGTIGIGMIESGTATRTIENETFYNQISWLRGGEKKEYTIGNLIIIFIEALQLKGIPETVMNEISDVIQDLLPVFVFAKTEDGNKEDQILTTIKELLAQAYYSNYNNEILETIDRIDSLLSFKRYFVTSDEVLQRQFIFYAKQYTPDGKQFHDQGEVFLLLAKNDKRYLDFALKSFEVSAELAPHEFFTPNAVLQMGIIYKEKGMLEDAREKLKEALEIFTSLDEVDKMRECDQHLGELN